MKKNHWSKIVSVSAAFMLGLTVFSYNLRAEEETEEISGTAEPTEEDTGTEAAGEDEPVSDAALSEEQEETIGTEKTEEQAKGDTDTEWVGEDEPVIEDKAVRTIMMYICGADLESGSGYATENIRQILSADFSKDESIRFIIMTGGTDHWYTPSEWLYDPATGTSPDEISHVYNQIWEARGSDAPEHPGQLILLDPDGVTGDGDDAVPNEDELMTQPETLRKFINYCAENYPAEQYDLILWDHGGGPIDSYGSDENFSFRKIRCDELRDVLANNAVTEKGGKFDFIDFDACLMSSVELLLAFADCTDYYIASPESIPGNGQYYTDWLNTVGEDPSLETYSLGKQIVDDFYEYYNGGRQDAALAVFDINALLDNDFVSKLQEWNDIMQDELLGNERESCLYYDELLSYLKPVQYGNRPYYDFGNFVSLAGIAVYELDETDISGNVIDDTNSYTEAAVNLLGLLQDPDIVYSCATDSFRREGQYQRNADGSVIYDDMRPRGIYSFFPDKLFDYQYYEDYIRHMNRLIDIMPEGDPRTEFLADYRNTILYYYMIYETGNAVSTLTDDGNEKDSIDYDKVMECWLYDPRDPEDRFFSRYHQRIEGYLQEFEKNGIDVVSWIEKMIPQMAEEAVSKENIEVKGIAEGGGTSYQITVKDTKKKVIDTVGVNINAELPAAQKYLDANPDVRGDLEDYELSTDFNIGFLSGHSGHETPEDNIEEYIRWLNDPVSVWKMDAAEDKWYAVQDAEGTMHVLDVSFYPNGDIITNCQFTVTDDDGEESRMLSAMIFSEDGDLKELFISQETGYRKVRPQDLKEPVTFLPIMTIYGPFDNYRIPISESPVTIDPETADQIKLVFTNVDNIPDIADTDGDGKKLIKKYVLRDIYNYEYDLTEQFENPDETLTDIEYAGIQDAVYNGEEQSPIVVYDGKELQEDTDYTWYIMGSDESCRDVKEYELLLYGKGGFTGESYKTFRILPASLKDAEVTGIENKPYTGEPVVQTPVIKLGSLVLEEGRDYTVSYENNIEAGTAAMTIIGIGNFADELEMTFEITSGMPESISITPEGPLEIPTLQTQQLEVTAVPEGTDNSVTWTSSNEKVAAVDENGIVTAKTYGKAVITASSVSDPDVKAEVTVQTRFHDVTDSSQSYYKPVYWGADNGVVAGFDKGVYFGPDEDCTRAQFVTFLWRLAGKPAGTKDVSFPDVDQSANYFRAVKWAVSQGIIVGFKHDNAPATFEPDGVVTRGQVATMLWRYGGRKTAKTGATFSDVKSTDNIYRAVSWGQEAGIIKGYKTGEYAGQFRPDDSCLRQHIVTFLFRYARDVMKKPV